MANFCDLRNFGDRLPPILKFEQAERDRAAGVKKPGGVTGGRGGVSVLDAADDARLAEGTYLGMHAELGRLDRAWAKLRPEAARSEADGGLPFLSVARVVDVSRAWSRTRGGGGAPVFAHLGSGDGSILVAAALLPKDANCLKPHFGRVVGVEADAASRAAAAAAAAAVEAAGHVHAPIEVGPGPCPWEQCEVVLSTARAPGAEALAELLEDARALKPGAILATAVLPAAAGPPYFERPLAVPNLTASWGAAEIYLMRRTAHDAPA